MDIITVGKYQIDPILFNRGFPAGCGPHACESSCCRAGVYVDVKERENILLHKETVQKYMDGSQTTDIEEWFDDEIELDSDFPSGRAVGTNVFNDKCVFLDSQGKCTLQVMAVGEGLNRWAIKPFFCIAFPITIENGRVTFDDFQQGQARCCSIGGNKEVPVIDSCKEELEFVLGDDGYRRLKAFGNTSSNF